MVLDDLGTLLQTAGLGTLGTSLFLGSVPMDAPLVTIQDALVALIEIPGLPPIHIHNEDAPQIEQPVVQVVTRGQPYGYAAARLQAHAAFVVLDSVHNQTLSGTFYLWIQAIKSPYILRVDDLHRPVLVFDVRCAKAL
jgi:hypothetical protein